MTPVSTPLAIASTRQLLLATLSLTSRKWHLSVRDKMVGPKVSLFQRFHSTTSYTYIRSIEQYISCSTGSNSDTHSRIYTTCWLHTSIAAPKQVHMPQCDHTLLKEVHGRGHGSSCGGVRWGCSGACSGRGWSRGWRLNWWCGCSSYRQLLFKTCKLGWWPYSDMHTTNNYMSNKVSTITGINTNTS